MNRKLEKKLQEANEKIEQLATANQRLQKQQGGGASTQIADEKFLSLKNEVVDLKETHRRELESLKMGIAEQSLGELKGEANALYEAMKQTLETERKLRLQLEKELNSERITKGADLLDLKKQVTILETVSGPGFQNFTITECYLFILLLFLLSIFRSSKDLRTRRRS